MTEYLKEVLHWLPCGPRIDFKWILLIKKALTSGKPTYLRKLLHTSGVRVRSSKLIQQRVPGKHKFADRAFKFSAPRLYNKLPVHIRNNNNIEIMKKDLKTFLYREAFDYKLDSILTYNPSSNDYTYNV